MDNKINLVEILKNCPKREKFYSTIYGEVEFEKIRKDSDYPIVLITKHGNNCDVLSDGRHYGLFDGECTLFPSREQRDWSKFTAPWYKQEKKETERFDPKTLKPFDKVIIRHDACSEWEASLFSHRYTYYDVEDLYSFRTVTGICVDCIPYNDDTKHLVGTTDDVPEFYKYWENKITH